MQPSQSGAESSVDPLARQPAAASRLSPFLSEPLICGLLLLIWLLATSWLRPLASPDEGRYAGVAYEMVRSGQWLTPTLDGLPYFHKPPLFYWLSAISMEIFGISEWAVRLASLIGAMVGAGSTYMLVRRWISPATSRWFLIVLATSPLFYGGAQYANHDMLVAGFIGGAIAFAADALLSLEAGMPWKSRMLMAWACMAFGLMSKGLIGVVLPSGVIFFWLLSQWRLRWILKLLWWPGPLLFALIASPWFVLMQLKFPEFFHYFFIHQHFERFAQKGFNNVQPFWFYPVALALTCLPWFPLLLTRFRLAAATDAPRKAVRTLLWLWIAVIVIFFSLPNSKLLGYVLPVLPAIAALIAEGMLTLMGKWRWLRSGLAVIAVATCVISMIAFTKSDDISSKPLAQAYREQVQAGDGLLSWHLYRFDFPFYAQLKEPLAVLSNWDDPVLLSHDSWPRELADASKFAPEAGQQVLLPAASLAAQLCKHPVTWIMASKNDQTDLLKSAETVAENARYELLRYSLAKSKLKCP